MVISLYSDGKTKKIYRRNKGGGFVMKRKKKSPPIKSADKGTQACLSF